MSAGLPLHHTPFLPRWSPVNTLSPGICCSGTLGINPGGRLVLGKGCLQGGGLLMLILVLLILMALTFTPSVFHSLSLVEYQTLAGMLALLSWPSWIPDLVLSFNPTVLLVGKQGHTRLCDAFPNPSVVKLLENSCLHLSHCRLPATMGCKCRFGIGDA